MTTPPNLPPLPNYTFDDGAEIDRVILAYGLAAYQAGRDAGLSAGFDAAFQHSQMLPATDIEGEHYARIKAEALVALKLGAKGGV